MYSKITFLKIETETLGLKINVFMYLIKKKKVIWSRESKVSKDFEPLAFDDTRLVSNQRINANRILVNKKPHDSIEWSLTIDNLELSDSNNYLCQLNSWPYDIYWLKRFMLNVYGWCTLFFFLKFFSKYNFSFFNKTKTEPPTFIDNSNFENSNSSNHENTVFVKTVNEYEDFSLKCLAKGKPKPKVTWFLKYLNGTFIRERFFSFFLNDK